MIGITALIYTVILCVAIVGDIEISEGFSRGLGCGISAWYATTANVAYYLRGERLQRLESVQVQSMTEMIRS